MAQPSGPDWLRAEREYRDDRFERGTIPELFEDSAERHLEESAQLYKGGIYDRTLSGIVPDAEDGTFAPLSYGELRELVRRLAAGFRDAGLEPDDRVGIFANTRMEWAQTDLALLAAGCVVSTVYTESSPKQVRYLLDDAGATAVVVENRELLERVLAVEDDLSLSLIVLVDDPGEYGERDDVVTLAEIYERGDEVYDHDRYRGWVEERDPDDLASLIYTSGTTGKPKGVRLTHWNFRSNVHQVLRRLGPRPDRSVDDPSIDADTTTISFLPLAHVFERTAGHFLMLGSGATVGYAEHPETIAEDIRKIRPTTGASVPRVFERIFDSMRQEAGESGPRRRIFDWSLEVAMEYQTATAPGPLLRAKHAIADRLVYRTVTENLGGRLEFLVSGGGSLSADLCRLFNGMGITVIEGYGLTETSPVITVNPPEDVRPGTMGPPVVGVDIHLDESRATPHDSSETRGSVGELLVRGDNVTDGYWNRPEETEEAFVDDLSDGSENQGEAEASTWFRTGDLVERTADDYLVFRERLKQILVLSTGKNVAPGPIEDAFATSERIDQVMIVGEDRKFVAALVVPNFDRIREWAEREDVSLPAGRDALCEDDRVQQWVGEAVEEINADLEPVERIKQFALVSEEWTADNDLLTPSMKKKRRNIHDVYADRIEAMYADAETQTATHTIGR